MSYWLKFYSINLLLTLFNEATTNGFNQEGKKTTTAAKFVLILSSKEYFPY